MITELEVITLQTADLTKFVIRVAKENPNWSRERLANAEKGYRQYMANVNIDKSSRPDLDVDEIWHAHILHTIDYADFCQRIFGRFIHHVPDENKCDDSCSSCHSEGESKRVTRSCHGNCSGHKTKAKCGCSKCSGQRNL